MELDAMNLRERQRDSARKIKYVTGKLQGVSTSHVEVTDEQGNATEIKGKQELEAAIIRENEAKFHQTEDCPLLNGQLLLDIGLLGDGPQVESILLGTYEIPADDPQETQDFLRAMKRPAVAVYPELPASLPSYRQSWKRARERTASGTIHYGHFKAHRMAKLHVSGNTVHFRLLTKSMETEDRSDVTQESKSVCAHQTQNDCFVRSRF